jgi:hypothetical protein
LFGGRRFQDFATHRLFHPIGDRVVADAQESLGRPLTNAFQVLRQSGFFLFGVHQAMIFFAKGLFAFLAPPALVSVAGGSVLHNIGCFAVRAVHARLYRPVPSKSIPI